MIQKNTALKWHISVCPFCGLGCGVEVGIANNIYDIHSKQPEYKYSAFNYQRFQ